LIPFGKILNKKISAENYLRNNIIIKNNTIENKEEIKFINNESLIKDEEEIIEISNHLLKHKKPLTDEEFGYYLAGLIEGDGYFGDSRLEIIFHKYDISLAYYIKKRIGYGNIYKIKNKNAYKYSLRHSKGLLKILKLINGKFINNNKIKQLIFHNYNLKFNIPILPPIKFSLLNNY
jgi:hypothetical protein